MKQKPPHQDYYSIKAKKDNYPARSAYKLQEIEDKFTLLQKAKKVLDLGASPGSWTQVVLEKAPQAVVVACDLQPLRISIARNIHFFQEDIFNRSAEFIAVLETYAPFDVVISDMAPSTTGSISIDAQRSLALCEEAVYIATQYLREGGSLVTKIFMGTDMKKYQQFLQQYFKKVHSFKPKSSKSESKEIFYIARGKYSSNLE